MARGDGGLKDQNRMVSRREEVGEDIRNRFNDIWLRPGMLDYSGPIYTDPAIGVTGPADYMRQQIEMARMATDLAPQIYNTQQRAYYDGGVGGLVKNWGWGSDLFPNSGMRGGPPLMAEGSAPLPNMSPSQLRQATLAQGQGPKADPNTYRQSADVPSPNDGRGTNEMQALQLANAAQAAPGDQAYLKNAIKYTMGEDDPNNAKYRGGRELSGVRDAQQAQSQNIANMLLSNSGMSYSDMLPLVMNQMSSYDPNQFAKAREQVQQAEEGDIGVGRLYKEYMLPFEQGLPSQGAQLNKGPFGSDAAGDAMAIAAMAASVYGGFKGGVPGAGGGSVPYANMPPSSLYGSAQSAIRPTAYNPQPYSYGPGY